MIENSLRGLSDYGVKLRRELHGSNVLTPPKRNPWYILFFEKFKDPLIQILSVAAVIALVLGVIKSEYLEPIGIIAAILLAVTIGFINEYSASKKFDILTTSSDDTLVKVRRNGVITQAARKDLVVDDIVLLEAGEEIPADIRIYESYNLKVNESVLTGESKAVTKKPKHPDDEDMKSTYPSWLLLRGTIIEEGSAVGVVEAVGDNTAFGQTARKAAEITDVETPLNKQLNGLADLINKIAFGAAGFLILALLVRYFFIEQAYVGQDWMQITNDLLSFLMIAVALIVVAVPEGLPMAVTLALAYSMKRMSKANNLVRKMHACETLGATTLILTDKTGTLTENRMEVVTEIIPHREYITINALVNSTAYVNGDKTIGNPTEGAIIKLMDVGDLLGDMRRDNPLVFRLDFSSKTKFMMSVIKQGDIFISLVKGAPEVVRDMCSATDVVGEVEEQRKGRRVIGFAYKESMTLEDAQKLNEFTYNGFMAIEDPIRKDVPDAVRAAKEAGIKVKIITGDNPATASEIARQARISNRPQAMAGIDIRNKTNPYDSVTGITSIDVFARTKPEDKQTLVKEFQALGEVVAMTGDGTNDAPALNHAEVGIAMNNGTDVAKEAADIILLDNSFPSIILGIKWGRSLYKNIQHFILFQLTINVVAILIACIGPFIGVDLPFTVTQMLWVNLIMDTFAALALATEPANDAVMKDKPRSPKAFIITKQMWYEIFGVGIVFFVFLVALLYTKAVSLTEFFTIFVLLQWWNLFNARVFGQRRSIFDGLLKNPAFVGVTLVILVGQFLIVQYGGAMFRTEPLPMETWGLILIGTSVVTVIRELYYQLSKIFK